MNINMLLQQGYNAHQQGDYALAREFYLKVLGQVSDNQDALLLMGLLCYETDEYRSAVDYFKYLSSLAPERTDFLGNFGAALQMVGDNTAAVPIYQRALDAAPDDQLALYNLASALKDAGELEEASLIFERLLRLYPNYAKAHNNYAVTCKLQGRYQLAIEHYEKAVELEPGYTLARLNLADLLQQEGRFVAAEDEYLNVLDVRPKDPTLHYKMGRFYQLQGRLLNALHHFETAVLLSPKMAEARLSLGVTQQALGRFESSVVSFDAALEIQPFYPEALIKKGNSLRELGRTEHARQAYEQALNQDPKDDANRVRLATLLPPIYASHDDLIYWRQHFSQSVSALQKNRLNIEKPVSQIGQTNFYLAYQGGNDRPLQESVASLYRPLLPEVVAAQSLDSRGERLRVGVISAFFYNHSVMHYYGRHVELMADDPDLELILLHVAGGQRDQITDHLKEKAARSLNLPHDLDKARQQIADLHLDVLIYLDIGLEPFTYFLAFTRLAPLQCVLAGHPVTTGIPTLDVFVSNLCNELPPEQAQAFYTERLVALDSLPVWYRKPRLPESFKTREELGLSSDKRIYLCPMTLFKVHPDMDQALATILAEDPDAEILFFRFKQTLLHEQLQQRFSFTIPDYERIRFLPWADSATFFSLMATADVLLDTFHFGGGNTYFLCFAVGTPMITWPSDYWRGRSGAGLYEKMQIHEPVAQTQADYPHLAVKFAKDSELRAQVKNRTLAQQDYLFENDEGPKAFLEWLKTQKIKALKI